MTDKAEHFKAVTERALGVRFVSFNEVSGGNSSRNFRAEKEDGGGGFVKFAAKKHMDMVFERQNAINSPLVPKLLAGPFATPECGGEMCVMEWRDGEMRDPAALTTGEIDSIVESYRALSGAMAPLAPKLSVPDDLGGATTVPIHGDLNWRNILYSGGKVSAFLDFESMRLGLAAEDLLRIPLHAMERTRFWCAKRMRKLESVLARIVEKAEYPEEDWLAALSIYIKRKESKRTKKGSFAPALALEKALREPMYRRVGRIIRVAAQKGNGNKFNRIIANTKLEEVGRGTRRAAYRVVGTPYCAKFYRTPEDCASSQKMKPSIKREIAKRRFDLRMNSSSMEVAVYDGMLKAMPQEIASRLPETCKRVFHPEWGWGVIETFYANPDGSAIIPYEFECRRQMENDAMRREIYIQSRDLLLALIREGAFFYEPGNFHVLIHGDGSIELKLVDFEPVAKTAIPLEKIWPWFRREKLRRKARRYLEHMRGKYRIAVTPETEIG